MDEIKLTELETELCEKLNLTLSMNNLTTTLRIAGGWVRDKILGLESHDIDISLDNMTGEAFANLFSANVEASSIGKIKANPDASKHLETACMRYNGIDLDFVNLRSEDYTENSRIPVIKLGTPLEDALRRDLTINSMFYNINLGIIEDFTGFGRDDLKNKIARTPLDPVVTFKDDPLRVLRTIRFASRFDLTILPEVAAAINNEQVLAMLHHKISRERIYKEFSLMMKGKNHLASLKFLSEFNLLDVVFKIPEGYPNLLSKGFALSERIIMPKNDSNLVLYSAAILLYYSLDGEFKIKRGKKDIPLYEAICEDLKMTNNEVSLISGIVSNTQTMLDLFSAPDLIVLSDLMKEVKEHYEETLILASHLTPSPEFHAQQIRDLIASNQLQNIWLEKILLTGHDLKNLFNIDGKKIGAYSKECFHWQVLHRSGTKEELIEHLRSFSPQ